MKSKNYFLLLLPCLLFLNPAFSEENKNSHDALTILEKTYPKVTWNTETVLSEETNGDKSLDYVITGKMGQRFKLGIVSLAESEDPKTYVLDFGLNDGAVQDSFCGSEIEVSFENQGSLVDMFSEEPEGYIPSKTRKGIRLDDGFCDSFHVYWNNEKKEYVWWRL